MTLAQKALALLLALEGFWKDLGRLLCRGIMEIHSEPKES